MAGKVPLLTRRSILAVDNAVMFLNSLKRYLQDEPYDLHCVTSGDEALKYLKDNKVDLILTDVEMPGMNGYELAREIKLCNIRAPIIFITANAEKEDLDRATAAGAASVLAKPFRTNQLLEVVKKYI